MTRASLPLANRGIVLVTTLILLLIMSVLGISALRATTLEERMSGNWRDRNLALQAAEAGLRAGERFIGPLTVAPTPHAYPCSADQTCEVFDPADSSKRPTEDGLMSANAADRDEWAEQSREYDRNDDGRDMPGVAALPRHLIEHRGHIRDHLVTGFGSAHETGRDQYRITARGTGQTAVARSVLQSLYIKRYN
tara:strand:+ start:1030 stop:1611 length:582 start_codon:yes stop_codon:yes gene_type:complete